MTFAYNYRIDGTALSTYCQSVKMEEGVSALRGDRVTIPYEHGAYLAARNWTQPRLTRLDTFLAGATTAAVYQNLHNLTKLLLDGDYLQRLDPGAGEVRARFKMSDGALHSGSHREFWSWPIWLTDGMWEAVAETSEADNGLTTTGTVGPLTVGGTHPTAPKFTITCVSAGADPKLVNAATGEQIYLPGNFATSDAIVVDCWERTVTLNGTRYLSGLSITRGWWMEFAAGATPSLAWTATSGTWDVTTAWRNRWH